MLSQEGAAFLYGSSVSVSTIAYADKCLKSSITKENNIQVYFIHCEKLRGGLSPTSLNKKLGALQLVKRSVRRHNAKF